MLGDEAVRNKPLHGLDNGLWILAQEDGQRAVVLEDLPVFAPEVEQ